MNSTDTAKSPPPCVEENDRHSFALDFTTRDGKVYGFPYTLLINYLRDKNSHESGNGDDSPPDQLSIWFSTHDVMILGWRLDRLRRLLRDGRIASVTARDPRYAHLDEKQPFVSEIIVTRVTQAMVRTDQLG